MMIAAKVAEEIEKNQEAKIRAMKLISECVGEKFDYSVDWASLYEKVKSFGDSIGDMTSQYFENLAQEVKKLSEQHKFYKEEILRIVSSRVIKIVVISEAELNAFGDGNLIYSFVCFICFFIIIW